MRFLIRTAAVENKTYFPRLASSHYPGYFAARRGRNQKWIQPPMTRITQIFLISVPSVKSVDKNLRGYRGN